MTSGNTTNGYTRPPSVDAVRTALRRSVVASRPTVVCPAQRMPTVFDSFRVAPRRHRRSIHILRRCTMLICSLVAHMHCSAVPITHNESPPNLPLVSDSSSSIRKLGTNLPLTSLKGISRPHRTRQPSAVARGASR